jgi:O-antigen biosynthesis protein WbqV
VPRTTFIAQWPILVLLLAGPRFFYQMLKGRSLATLLAATSDDARVPVLLVGAGDAADTFIREMARSATAPYRVVGIVDDKPSRIGREMRGVRVEGGLDDLAAVIERLEARGQRPQRLVIAGDRIDGKAVRRLLDLAEPFGLALARLPRLTEFRREGGASDQPTRPIDVEDLLQRPQRNLDREAMRRLVAGKRVLVTGAGGTIGGELARQIADLGPSHLALLDNGEFALYAIDLEIAERRPALARSATLADVGLAPRVEAAFRALKPELVFHAAALKHVPIVEGHPLEGIRTNVLGTRNVADACVAHDVEAMVLISTDKAVNPSSAMGATKRVAEMYCQALSLAGGSTRFVTVRFGNVLGSTGSVVPLFQRQIARGGPITVTHPDMTRYFMTVREAVELVLSASAGAAEAGGIFVLDMGEPVRIVDLARQMARLAGLRPDKDIAIAFTGLRKGEKLAETLFHEAEPPRATAIEGVTIAHPRAVDFDDMAAALDRIGAALVAGRDNEALAVVRRLVPEYSTPEQ